MKDFFSTAKFKILVALVVVLAGMMAWAGANNRLTSAPQELLGAAAVPFQKIGALLSEGVSGVVTKYAEYDSIVEENEQLNRAVAMSGLPKQEYCYRKCMDNSITVTPNPRIFKALKTALDDVWTELRRISTGTPPSDELVNDITLIAKMLNDMKGE